MARISRPIRPLLVAEVSAPYSFQVGSSHLQRERCMTYDQTRNSEQLSYLDDAIAEFISRYNFNVQSTGRRTIIFFPGGMGSRLLRATTPEPDGPPFFYNTVWLDASIAFGAASHLRMQNDIDYQQQVVVPDGPLDLLILRPYKDFIEWCENNNVDYFIFGWDWRRDPQKSVDFFLNVFMPRFEQRVSGCIPNPLSHLSLVGHSFGGMIVKLILNQQNNPYVQLVHSAVTVATPFYGYGGQLARYFIGDPDLYFTASGTWCGSSLPLRVGTR
jgi:pimeloyl-ACP methyl ester carboxylesterase